MFTRFSPVVRASLVRTVQRYASTASGEHNLILGCGSNVMDLFFRVRKLPAPGEKQYFAGTQALSASVVGGVTLNHLAWAARLGAKTGLLALQGDDEYGKSIRSTMLEMGVSPQFVKHGSEYATSVSHVFLEENGERSIMMAPASTSSLDGDAMRRYFGDAVHGASMVTSEISQVPLSGVNALFTMAADRGLVTFLDVDVPPSVALGPAQLCTSPSEIIDVISKCTVLKLTATAAEEVLALKSKDKLSTSLKDVAVQIAQAFGTKLTVVTGGMKGSGLSLSVGSGRDYVSVQVPAVSGITQIDATGAGDAFFGGMIASVNKWGLPQDDAALVRLGAVASACGAACCEVVGALPGYNSRRRVEELCKEVFRMPAKPNLTSSVGDGDGGTGTQPVPSADDPDGIWSAVSTSLNRDAATLRGLTAYYSGTGKEEDRESLMEACRTIAQRAATNPSSGTVYITGIGKSGVVAQRLATSLRSVGVRAQFIHGGEWVHGDLGVLAPDHDCVVLLSHSGVTPELVDVLGHLQRRSLETMSIVGASVQAPLKGKSTKLAMGTETRVLAVCEPELLGMIPTCSITAQESIGNAIVSGVTALLKVSQKTFKFNHPGGAIGKSHH